MVACSPLRHHSPCNTTRSVCCDSILTLATGFPGSRECFPGSCWPRLSPLRADPVLREHGVLEVAERQRGHRGLERPVRHDAGQHDRARLDRAGAVRLQDPALGTRFAAKERAAAAAGKRERVSQTVRRDEWAGGGGQRARLYAKEAAPKSHGVELRVQSDQRAEIANIRLFALVVKLSTGGSRAPMTGMNHIHKQSVHPATPKAARAGGQQVE